MTNTVDNNDAATQLFSSRAAQVTAKAVAKPQESQFSPYISGERATEQIAQYNQTFRPTIYDENLRPINTSSTMHQIAEIPVEDVGYSVREELGALETVAEQDDATEEVTSLKLNTRGWIAVASFFAVLLLVTVLIIINAVSLGGSSARISTLQAEQTELRAQLSAQDGALVRTFNERSAEIRRQIQTYGSYNGIQFEYIGTPTQLPPIPTLRPLPNPDHSTNWFNDMSRWFSGLFR